MLVMYGLNFSFKIQFLSFSWRKDAKFLPVWPIVLVLLRNTKVPEFQENSPVPKNSYLYACTLMTYLMIALRKNLFIDSLVEHFKKIMKMLNV